MRAIPITLLTGLLLGLAAGGCGDDAADQLDASELVSRANEICRGGVEGFAEIQSDPPSNAKEAHEQTSELVELAGAELVELRELRAPEELRDPYEAYLEARAGALEALERGRDAAADRDAEAYLEAQAEATAAKAKRIKLAKAVGLRDCSEPSPRTASN
ncbi:MAG: hypothetical protein M3O25_03830 [Actinomycetota bacterium]|nr:hypothetical protein [Actinomycetota bacterium]